MNVLYGLLPARRGHDYRSTASEHVLHSPRRRHRGRRSAWFTSTSCWSPVFTVAENLILGARRRSTARRAQHRARRGATVRRALATATASTSIPDALSRTFPVGVQQRVEILKALGQRCRSASIFDEPTAVLTPQETDELIAVMRSLRDERQSDRLHHPQAARGACEIADKITVIRHGKVVGAAKPHRLRV